MVLLCNENRLIQKRKLCLLFGLLLSGGISSSSYVAFAQSGADDNKSADQIYDNSMNGLTDWHMISAGGGGDWKTAIGRVQSNVKDINNLGKAGNPLLPQPEHLLGTWWGINPWLYKHGINLNLDNQNEFAGNITGGTRRRSSNTGAVDANLDIDWGTLVGKNWLTNGLVSHMTVIGRYGANLSPMIGEKITQVQELYGGGGNVVAKLVNLYNDKRFLDGKIVTSFGRTNVGGFYATSPIHCYFMNNGICGNPKPLSGQSGFTAWPDSEWGITTLFRPLPQFYIRIGMFQVNRYSYGNEGGKRAGWAAIVKTAGNAGGEFPLEFGFEPRWGKNELVGHYKAGFTYDTSSYPVWGRNINGGHITTANGADQRWKRGRDTEWLLLDQMIHRNGPGDLNGLIGYIGYVHSNPLTFQRQNEIMVGMIDTGFWKARPMDGIGFLFVHQIMSGKMRDAQRYNLAHGFPIADITSGVTGIQTAETTFEATYIIHIYRGVRFQPDFQYEIHPNAQKNINDAAFLGFKSRVDF